MTLAETAKVLAKMAAYDQRTVGDADVAAWHEILGHLDIDSCLAAVTIHYRENSSRPWPSEIRKLATELRVRSRSSDERRKRAIEESPHATRTGNDMVRYVLNALADAGQDVAKGRLLGRQRASDIAEDAVTHWLATTDHAHTPTAVATHPDPRGTNPEGTTA